MTYYQALKKATQYLKNQNVEDPSYEAGLLLSWALKKDISYVYSHGEDSLTFDQEKAFFSALEARGKNKPYAYITNEQWFMGLNFYINEHVLIPRDDTETLVETALYALGKSIDTINQKKYSDMFQIAKKDTCRILDVGTGSGCIAISLLKFCEKCVVDALDISAEAFCVAKENARRHQVDDRISFINADFMDFSPSHKYDIIVSNPPYIPSCDIKGLMSSVRDFEPVSALDGGEDGLIFYRALAKGADALLGEGGILIVECGFDQAQAVSRIFKANFLNPLIFNDLSGVERVVAATKDCPIF